MNSVDWLFWNVDTQFDFVSPQGKLYVEGAELLKPVWETITNLAKKQSICVVNTADYHFPNSAELSSNPDFIKTFPPHCMANTLGADYIEETNPENPLIFDWDKQYAINSKTVDHTKYRNIVIRKDAFDVFSGSPFTEKILNQFSPKNVVVYGVTTNVCVNDAVVGLAKRVSNVYVIEEAIKELPTIPLPFDNWKDLGVKMISLKDLEILLNV